ncbi:MAG: helix-turn-helix domain-containing protein [Chryseobacterium sp.]
MGKLSGRKPKMTPDKLKAAKKLLEGGIPPKEVAKTLEISIATLYR